MFNLTDHSKADSESNSVGIQGNEPGIGSIARNLLNCPALLSGMSREMRTQMNSIVSFAYLLNNKEYNSEEKEGYSLEIYNSCQQIISLFDNFLDSAIIDTGNSVSEARACRPDKLFGNLFTQFREELAKDKYQEVIFVSEDPPFIDEEYLLDATRVSRIVRNLFQNSLHNTRTGYIKATYNIRNEVLFFSILDSGHGFQKSQEFLKTDDPGKSLKKFNDIYSAVNLILARNLVTMLRGSWSIAGNGLTGTGISFSIPASKAGNEMITQEFTNSLITI